MKRYGLIGHPLGHSLSRSYFNQKFCTEHIDAEYVNFDISDMKELKDILRENPDLNGLNVTLPYKTRVIPLLDELDKDAELIGAVNVIKFQRGRFGKLKLKGYNSDITGFKDSIRPLLNPTHKKALILGTGGASKAVFQGLKQLGIEPLYVSRTKTDTCITYGEITSQIMHDHTVVINATPLGMAPDVDKSPDIPYGQLTPDHLLYDLLYNPDETLFMKKGAARGAGVKNGLEMLLLQAFVSWKIWNE
ncbi:MAG: shikimate dehydrogenase [Tannerella sp.]|nr:shikimate dehydrogenase [Tannerella sp.]